MSEIRESWWMSAMSNLRKCPFCGGEAGVFVASPEDNDHLLFKHYSVACPKCGIMIGTIVHGQTDFFDTVAEAVGAWNTRYERTCHCVDEVEDGPFYVGEYTLSCGHKAIVLNRVPNYCPECGAKVVRTDDDTRLS